jgi:membrane protein YqaA with SNARE-associated domain
LFKPIRRLYDWVLSWAESRYGMVALVVLAFAESSFFPIPPDVLLIALCLGARHKWLHYAAACSVASVLGGLGGYAIGAFGYEALGAPIIEFYGAAGKYLEVQALYQEHGFAVVFLAGFTPIPYKVFTIAAGVFDLSLIPFTGASLISRSARFFIVAGLLRMFGAPVKLFIDRWFNLLTIVFSVLLIGGFLLVKYALH